MPTPTTDRYRLADILFDGKLAERIADLRSQHLAWNRVAAILEQETAGSDMAFTFTGQTVRVWALELGLVARENDEVPA